MEPDVPLPLQGVTILAEPSSADFVFESVRWRDARPDADGWPVATQALVGAMVPLGARVERDPARATHVVAWRAADVARWPEAERRVAAGAAAAVTPLWLWQAVVQRAAPPLGDPLWRSMPVAPLMGAPAVEITLTGFLGDFRAALLSLADAAGMRVTRPMNLVSCTHLLAADVGADATSEKLRRAREPAQAGRIAVVNPAWLYDCVRAGRILPGAAYGANVPGGALEPATALGALGWRPPVEGAPPSPRRAGTPDEAVKENVGPAPAADKPGESGATEVPDAAPAAAPAPPRPPADDVLFSQPASRRLHFSQLSDDRPSGESSRGVTASELAAARGAAGALAKALAVDTQAKAGMKASAASGPSAEQAAPAPVRAADPAVEPAVAAEPGTSAPAAAPVVAPAADAPEPARQMTRKRRSEAGAAAAAAAVPAPAAAAAPAADRAKQRKTGRPARAAATASQPPVAAAANQQPAAERKGRRAVLRRAAAEPEPAAPAAPPSSRPTSARPFFAVGGLHSAEAAAAVAALRRLGVSAEGGPAAARWRARTTHVLEPHLRRSARTLAALAAGAWLLNSDYAAACAAAGRLLPEGPHELAIDPSGRVARRAPAHWRRRAASTGGGAFAGLTVAVLPGLAPDGAGPDKDGVERVLAAGGATVVPAAAAVDRGADFVVAPPCAAAGDGRTGALRRAKMLLVSPAFVVNWLAQPMADLAPHVLFGGVAVGGLAARVAARGAA